MIVHVLTAADKLMCLQGFVIFAKPTGNQKLTVGKLDICLFAYVMNLNQVLEDLVNAIQRHSLQINRFYVQSNMCNIKKSFIEIILIVVYL